MAHRGQVAFQEKQSEHQALREAFNEALDENKRNFKMISDKLIEERTAKFAKLQQDIQLSWQRLQAEYKEITDWCTETLNALRNEFLNRERMLSLQFVKEKNAAYESCGCKEKTAQETTNEILDTEHITNSTCLDQRNFEQHDCSERIDEALRTYLAAYMPLQRKYTDDVAKETSKRDQEHKRSVKVYEDAADLKREKVRIIEQCFHYNLYLNVHEQDRCENEIRDFYSVQEAEVKARYTLESKQRQQVYHKLFRVLKEQSNRV